MCVSLTRATLYLKYLKVSDENKSGGWWLKFDEYFLYTIFHGYKM